MITIQRRNRAFLRRYRRAYGVSFQAGLTDCAMYSEQKYRHLYRVAAFNEKHRRFVKKMRKLGLKPLGTWRLEVRNAEPIIIDLRQPPTNWPAIIFGVAALFAAVLWAGCR